MKEQTQPITSLIASHFSFVTWYHRSVLVDLLVSCTGRIISEESKSSLIIRGSWMNLSQISDKTRRLAFCNFYEWNKKLSKTDMPARICLVVSYYLNRLSDLTLIPQDEIWSIIFKYEIKMRNFSYWHTIAVIFFCNIFGLNWINWHCCVVQRSERGG